MSIEEKQTCNMHTKEKEKSGTCCHVKDEQENAEQLTYEHYVQVGPAPKEQMNKLFLVLALLFALSACSVGKKCTYTQDGTKISSWIWFYGSDKPIDLDKNNCN
jgi:hypothetical protein